MTKENEVQKQIFPLVNTQEYMTEKDYACIHLKVPKTGKPFTNTQTP